MKLLDGEVAKPAAAVVHTNAGARMSWTPGPAGLGEMMGLAAAPDTGPEKKVHCVQCPLFQLQHHCFTKSIHHDDSSFCFVPLDIPFVTLSENRGPPTRVIAFSNCLPWTTTKLLDSSAGHQPLDRPFCTILFVALVDTTTPSVLTYSLSFPVPQQS